MGSEFIASLKLEQQKAVLLGRMKLEATLAKLNALESKKLAMQVSSTTRGKGRLQRMSTTLHMDDPAANDAIKSAMADLGQTAGGRDAVAGLLKKHSSQRAF